MFTDAELMNQLKRGNERAVEVLLERFGDRLLRTALGICGDLQIAEEVVQDAMLQVCQKIHGFEERSSLGTWMFRITVNMAKNRTRGNWLQRFALREGIRVEAVPAPEGNQPEVVVIREEQGRNVMDCLQELPAKYRDVLVLYYLEDFSVQEISRILEQPEGTVKSKMSRGRALLKERLTIRGVAK